MDGDNWGAKIWKHNHIDEGKNIKHFYLFILILLSFGKCLSQNPNYQALSTNVLCSVYLINYHNSCGTSFTLEYGSRQYLITAKHVLEGIKDSDTIQIFYQRNWTKFPVSSIVCPDPDIDITILGLNQLLVAQPGIYGLHILSGTFQMTQDVFYLGFPYLMTGFTGSSYGLYTFPIVKKGIFSSVAGIYPNDKSYIIDGLINPGFSGGPIVIFNSEKKEWQVAAVINSYRNQIDTVYDGLREYNRLDSLYHDHVITQRPIRHPTDQYVLSNSGIFFGSSIGHAIMEIEKKPIGYKIP